MNQTSARMALLVQGSDLSAKVMKVRLIFLALARQEVAAKIPAHLAESAQRKPLNWGQSIHQTDTPCTNCAQSGRQQSSEILQRSESFIINCSDINGGL